MPVGRQLLTVKPMTASGRRNKLVTIEQLTESAPNGFPVETWSTLTTAWMARRDDLGSERFTASQEAASTETYWHMSYLDDMDPELVDVPKRRRLSYQGRFFDIISASIIENRQGIELLTQVASGV